LLSPAIELGRPWARRLRVPFGWLSTADARLPFLQRRLARFSLTKGGSDISDLEVRRTHPGYRQVPLRALLNLIQLQRIAWDAAPALTQPALVMHAANDIRVRSPGHGGSSIVSGAATSAWSSSTAPFTW
jgi:hypothetical protein